MWVVSLWMKDWADGSVVTILWTTLSFCVSLGILVFGFERVTSCVMVLIFMFIFPMFASCAFILSPGLLFPVLFWSFSSALCVSSSFALPFALFPPHVIIPERFTCASLTTSGVLNSAGTLSCLECFLCVSPLCFFQFRLWHSAWRAWREWRAQPGILALGFKSLVPKC